jgi:hypothetical protein
VLQIARGGATPKGRMEFRMGRCRRSRSEMASTYGHLDALRESGNTFTTEGGSTNVNHVAPNTSLFAIICSWKRAV